MTLLDNALNRTIGFGDFFSKLDRTTSKFPHYNIIEGTDRTTIELALAGYSKNDIEVQVCNENFLKIFSTGVDKQDDKKYTHRGIAKRSFSITFGLGNFVEVSKAEMADGILSVDLTKIIPQEKLPKKITIN